MMQGNLAKISTTMAIEAERQPETLDEFLHYWALERPQDLALVDAYNRSSIGLGEPTRINFAQAERVSEGLATLFSAHGLTPGNTIAVQLPNIIELPLVLMGAMRAGLTTCLLPVFWHHHEINQALHKVPVQAVVTVGELANHKYAETICHLAFDHMSIRYIYGIGPNQPDGVTPLTHIFEQSRGTSADYDAHSGLPGMTKDDPAVITWSIQPGQGLVPVYRTHQELIAAGLLHINELDLTMEDRFLNTYALTSLTSLASMFVPWLLTGGSLVQHHPFEYSTFLQQLVDEQITYTTVPTPVIASLSQDGVLEEGALHLKKLGCIWPAPHLTPSKEMQVNGNIPIYDIRNLHEKAIYLARRKQESDLANLKLGSIGSDKNNYNGSALLETRIKGRIRKASLAREALAGTLYVRGASVSQDFVPEKATTAANSTPLRDAHEEWVSTGIHCSICDSVSQDVICAADPDLIYHGGTSVSAQELDELYQSYDKFSDAAVFTRPDPVIGERIFAAVVPAEQANPTLAGLKDYLRTLKIAPFKEPEVIVVVSEIPRDDAGRILRDEIPL